MTAIALPYFRILGRGSSENDAVFCVYKLKTYGGFKPANLGFFNHYRNAVEERRIDGLADRREFFGEEVGESIPEILLNDRLHDIHPFFADSESGLRDGKRL